MKEKTLWKRDERLDDVSLTPAVRMAVRVGDGMRLAFAKMRYLHTLESHGCSAHEARLFLDAKMKVSPNELTVCVPED